MNERSGYRALEATNTAVLDWYVSAFGPPSESGSPDVATSSESASPIEGTDELRLESVMSRS